MKIGQKYNNEFIKLTQMYHSYLHNVGGLISNIAMFANSFVENIDKPNNLIKEIKNEIEKLSDTYDSFYNLLPENTLLENREEAKHKYAGTSVIVANGLKLIEKHTEKIAFLLNKVSNGYPNLAYYEDYNDTVRDLKKLKHRLKNNIAIKAANKTVHLKKIIEDSILIVKKGFRNIEFKFDVKTDKLIYGNSIDIEQVFENLLKNSAESMQNAGKILITIDHGNIDYGRISKSGEMAVVTIIDEGPGIDERHLKDIFTYGFSTKNTDKNRGIGLAFVKQVVDSHMGMIFARNENLKGARFTVYLPTTL